MNDGREWARAWASRLSRLALGVCLVGVIVVSVAAAKGPDRSLNRGVADWQRVFSETFETGLREGWAVRDERDGDGDGGWGACVDDVALEVRRGHEVFLPLLRRDLTLENGGFEADWGDEKSHRVLIFPTSGEARYDDLGNVFTPPGWLTWYLHGKPVEHDPSNENGWVQPEVNDAWLSLDQVRVHSGQKGIHMFKTSGIFDGGFLQRVEVEPGTGLRLSAWAHAWSNWQDGPRPGDPRWSEGPGYDCGFKLEGETLEENWRNFTFRVGIDPTGGHNPYADTVVWGWGAHIYNCYHEVPHIEVEAESSTVTVFLRSRVLWPFRDNNAYWDDVTLERIW